MAAEIIIKDGKIFLVKPDQEIAKEDLVKKIQNLRRTRQDLKAKRDKTVAKIQEVQSAITEWEDVLAQAGGP